MLVALVTAAGLSTVAAAPAAATTTPECGQSGTPAVVALADPSFYIDSSAGLDATYAGYTVRAGAAAENGLWLTLDGFTGGSVGLAPGQPGTVAQPNITAGSANTSTGFCTLVSAGATTTSCAQPRIATAPLHDDCRWKTQNVEVYQPEREKQVILSELGESVDSPEDLVHDHLFEAAFTGQALGRPVLGNEETVRAATSEDCRDWLKRQRIFAVIPHKDNQAARSDPTVKFDKQTYRQRAVIEQCVGWLKECRRIGTRFEKLAVHFHGMLQLAMIRRYLKLLFSDRA